MNETGSEESFTLLSEDTVKLSIYIESSIPDALNLLSSLETVPVQYLPQGSISTSTNNEEDNCTIISLPEDFIRLISVRLKEWKREVQTIYPYGGDDYKVQHNVVTQSGVNKPSCVFAYTATGRCIECHPKGTLQHVYYVKRVSSSDDDYLSSVNEALFIPLCYMCAYVVYQIFEMPNTAEQMYKISLQSISKL